MKKVLNSKIFYFFLGLFLMMAIPQVYAAWNTKVSSGDVMTSAKWNDLVDKVEQLDSDKASKGYVDSYFSDNFHIETGMAQNGDTLPVPSGFGESECEYFVSMHKATDYGHEDGDHDHGYSIEANGRDVEICWIDDNSASRNCGDNPNGGEWDYHTQSSDSHHTFEVNYLIMCKK